MSLEASQAPSTPLPVIKPLAAPDPSQPAAESQDYFDRKPLAHPSLPNHTPRTSTYPLPTTPPAGFLRTPPIPESLWPTFSRSATEDSVTSAHRRIGRSNSPQSWQQSTQCLSPGSHSSLGPGNHSSGASSGSYLTPPPDQVDCDLPPYRPRRILSESLTMKWPKRSDADPDAETRRPKRHRHRPKRKQNQSRKLTFYYQDRASWYLPRCYVSPTAPTEYQKLCEDNLRDDLPYRKMDIRCTTEKLSSLMASPASVIKRRWSSVEIGAHKLPCTNSVPQSAIGNISDSSLFRSSTARGAGSTNEVISIIKKTLTSRKVPIMQNPATITLRRPSDASTAHQRSSESSHRKSFSSGSVTLREEMSNKNPQHTHLPAAYLITPQDVNSITALIYANLHYNEPKPEICPVPKIPSLNLIVPAKAMKDKRPSITNHGLLPSIVAPADATVTAEGVQSTIQVEWDRLNVGSHSSQATRKLSSLSRPISEKSVHEVIWEDNYINAQNSSSSSLQSPGQQEDNHVDELSPLTPRQTPTFSSQRSEQDPEHYSSDSAFDSSDAHASIERWAWFVNSQGRTPVCTPKSPPFASDTDYFAATERLPNSLTHRLRKTDVISFPPLKPRKLTSDWISPLPDISKPLPSPPGLYAEGIDTTHIPSSTPPRPHVTFKGTPPHGPIIRKLPGPKSCQDLRRTSVVQPHPCAPARAGHALAVGSALGSSTGARRKSSTPRISIMDAFRVDKLNLSAWRKPRGSLYPSIVDPLAVDEGCRLSPTSDTQLAEPANRLTEARAKIVEEKAPPLSGKVDRVGIYNEVSGASTVKRPSLEVGASVHECDNCADYPDRMPSVDWIG